MRKILIGYLICFFSQTNLAQNTAKISGKISGEKGQVVEFANVMLHNAEDSVFLKASLTNEFGVFDFENLPMGNFFLKISHTSYLTFMSPPFILSKENLVLNFKNIVLKTNEKALAEVTVKATKPFIERQLDRTVVNVENSIVSAGSNVLEVLQRAPNVQINQETSINMSGKSGIIFMIDGKVSPLAGADLITYLKGLPASQVANIELITNPSARYDAAGNAGIINLKLKKDKNEGFNGTATASLGKGIYYKPSGSINFNYRDKKWNLFGSHGTATPTQLSTFYINRKFFNEDRSINSVFDQDTYIKIPTASHNSRLGIDYYLSKNTIVGATINTNLASLQRKANTESDIFKANGQADYYNSSYIDHDENRQNLFANLNFKHNFGADAELTADLDFGRYTSATVQDITNTYTKPGNIAWYNTLLKTDLAGELSVKSIKADYSKNLPKNSKIELGFKSSLVESDNNMQFFNIENKVPIVDKALTNHFKYAENVNALYASFAQKYSKGDMQLGLRTEHTNTDGRQLTTGETFSRNYVNFFPNILFNRVFDKNNQLSVSYSKRLDRPSYRNLNPLKVFVDAYTYVQGDPTLTPQYNHIYEIAYTFKNQYITTINYTRSINALTDVFAQDDATKISYQTPANIRQFDQWYANIYVPIKLIKNVNSVLTVSGYWNRYSGPLQGGQLTNTRFTSDGSFNNTISLPKNWSAELITFYITKSNAGLFTIKPFGAVNFGLQKTSNNKLHNIKANFTDAFRTNHIAVIVDYLNMDFHTDRRWDSRVFTLAYSYRFGKQTVARSRQRNSGIEDEKKRAN